MCMRQAMILPKKSGCNIEMDEAVISSSCTFVFYTWSTVLCICITQHLAEVLIQYPHSKYIWSVWHATILSLPSFYNLYFMSLPHSHYCIASDSATLFWYMLLLKAPSPEPHVQLLLCCLPQIILLTLLYKVKNKKLYLPTLSPHKMESRIARLSAKRVWLRKTTQDV